MGKLPLPEEAMMCPPNRNTILGKEGRKIFFITALFLCILSDCPECAGGELSISPSLSLREEYDDNIYLVQDNKTSDFITRVSPSVSLAYRTPIWDVTFKDTFYWWYYEKRDRGYYSNDANLSSKLTVIKNLIYFDVTDTYTSVVLNSRGPSTTANLNVNRTDSNSFNASPYIKYQLDPVTAVITGYTYTSIWYRSGGGIGRQQHKGYFTVEHLFSEKLNALLRVEYMADMPESTEPNNNQMAAESSVVYTFDPRTKFEGTFGYRWIRFSGGPNRNGPIYDAGVVYRFAEKGQVQLRASQQFGASPTEGVVESGEQKITASYGESLSIHGAVYHTRDNYVEIGQTNDALGVTAGFSYRPDPRTTYRISGKYEKDRYSPQDDKRDIYGASAGIDYKLTTKATVSLTYDYNRSTGQIETDNYTDSIVGLQLRVEL